MKLAIIGTGKIVHEALFALEPVDSVEVVAIFARPHSREKAEALAEKYGIGEVYTDYDELLAGSDAQAVYIGLVNSAHFSYAKKALLAGKDVILEKPLTTTAAEAKELQNLTKETGKYVLEAITTLHSQIFDLMQMELPNLGNIRSAQLNYSQYSSRYTDYLAGKVAPAFDPECSGGALYDINLYNVYFVVGLLGSPETATYFPNRGFNGIDTSGTAILTYPTFNAVCTGAKDSDSPCFSIIQGEKGWMRVNGKPNVMTGLDVEVVDEENPRQVPSASGGMQRAVITRHHEADPVHHRMTREFGDFARIIEERDDEAAAKAIATSVEVMTVLETARKAAGIRFGVDAD